MDYISSNGETWNTYLPTNSTEFKPTNIISMRIPRANFIMDLSRSYLTLELDVPVDINNTTDAAVDPNTQSLLAAQHTHKDINTALNREAVDASTDGLLGIRNAATVFDIVNFKINGQELYHNEFHQASTMLDSFNKSKDWVKAHPYSLLDLTDIKDLSSNNQLIFSNDLENNTALVATTGTERQVERKHLVIPLSMLFPLAENLTEWPCYMLEDCLELEFYVSNLSKYVTLLVGSAIPNDAAASTKTNQFTPIPIKETGKFTYGDPDPDKKAVKHVYQLNDATIKDVVLYTPCHNPQAEEIEHINSLMTNAGGMAFSFRHWEVLNSLSPYTTGAGDTSRDTQQLNFSCNSNNIFGVSMLALPSSCEVIYEKPCIDSIQVNMGPWSLASNGTHIYNNYDYGGDMLNTLLDNMGQNNLQFYQTVGNEVLHDYAITKDKVISANGANYRPTGSYMTWYDCSPGDELGVGSAEFSNLIVYKYSIGSYKDYACNNKLGKAKTYCMIQTFSSLIITKDQGVTCQNISSRYLTSKFVDDQYGYFNQLKAQASANVGVDYNQPGYEEMGFSGIPKPTAAHGYGADHGVGAVLGTVLPMIPNVFKGIVGGIKKLHQKVRSKRSNRHLKWLAARIPQDVFEKHYDALVSDSYYIFPKRWKRTYRQLKEQGLVSHGALIPRHGTLVPRHGIDDDEHDLTYSMRDAMYKNMIPAKHRLRFSSWGRYCPVNPRMKVGVKHGMETAYHGFFGWLKNLFTGVMGKIKKIIPSLAKPTISTGKEILTALINGKLTPDQAKKAGKELLKKTGINILSQIQQAIPVKGVSNKASKLYSLFKNNPSTNIGSIIKNLNGGRFYSKVMGNLRSK